MSNTFKDGYTKWLNAKMSDYEERIYDMEDDMASFNDNEEQIIEYLKDVHFSAPLGLSLRRYLCTKYAIFDGNKYNFNINGKSFSTCDYMNVDYNIETDELKEYSDIIYSVMLTNNIDESQNAIEVLTKAEIKRMLKVTSSCTRQKMLLLSFALHMSIEEVHKFYTDVLAEQTYNFRNPEEIIAFFCQSHDEYNSYFYFNKFKKEYLTLENIDSEDSERENYTAYASKTIKDELSTVDDLMSFLKLNVLNFNKYPKTAYIEFMRMYEIALKKTKIQTLSNDEYVSPSTANTQEQLRVKTERKNNAIELQQATNSEQLAKEMLSFIPRYTRQYKREDKKGNIKTGIETDFISISNGEKGQKSKKVQTTTLPKEITMNLMISDRLEDLRRKKKQVTRKDLVFMKFYLLSLDMQQKDQFTANDYFVFIDECNDLLIRCGFSRLYPGNRYENLIMLSLLSSNPYEMYENILEYSFFNEPEYIGAE